MQRQKTIAKWLAIILLLTAIIACYVAFRAIMSDKAPSNFDIAGADSDGSGDDNTTPPPLEDDKTPQPVYSAFPRLHETVNGLTVRHVGGEANDVFLDSVYFAGNRFVMFYSASIQYDVKDCGIHIAVFNDTTLQSVTQVSTAEESFVAASVVQNGLLIITKNAMQTKLRLYDSSCRLIAENYCDIFTSYKLYVTSAGVKLFATDARYLCALTITNDLDVIRSNFVYPLVGCEIFYSASIGSADTLFVQSAQGIGALTFNSNSGFKYHFEDLNSRLLQILPFALNGQPAFLAVAKCDEGIKVISIDATMKSNATYLMKSAQTATATIADNGNICIIADGAQAVFCSHLELQSSQALQYDDTLKPFVDNNVDKITHKAIEGEKGLFIISCDNTHYIAKLENSKFTALFKVSGKNLKTVRERMVNGVSKLSIIFDGTIINDFAYMCFGASDVFYITLPQ